MRHRCGGSWAAFVATFCALALTAAVLPAAAVAATPTAPDLAVVLTAPATVPDNAPIAATVTVANQGTAIAPAPVRMQLTLTAAISATAAGPGWACAAPIVTIFTVTIDCTASQTVAPGAAVAGLDLQATPNPKTLTVGVVATVTDPGPVFANNRVMRDVTVLRPDLGVDISPTYAAIARGGSVPLTVQVVSRGTAPTPAPVVQLAATGFATLAAAGTGWSCSPAPILCTAANGLAPGVAAPPLVVNAAAGSVNAAGSLTATLTGSDYLSANNIGSAVVAIGDHPDLQTTVTAGAPMVKSGDTALFAVDIRNVGVLPQTAGIDVRIMTEGLQPARGGGSGWTCADFLDEEITCRRTGTLGVGAAAPTLTVQGGVAATYPDSVSIDVQSSAPDDLNLLNDTDFADSDVAPDHALAITLDPIAPTSSGLTVPLVARVASVGAKSIDGPTTVAFQASGATLSASGTGWSCASTSCVSSASLDPGGVLPVLTVQARVMAPTGGRVSVDVSIFNDNDETDDDDSANQGMDVPIATDRTPPTNARPTAVGNGFLTVSPTVRLAWTASDPSGIRDYDVELNHRTWEAGKAPVRSMFATATTTTTGSLLASPGSTECIRVRARDNAGNQSAWSAEQCTVIPLSVKDLSRQGQWLRDLRSDVVGGELRTSTTRGDRLTLSNTQAHLFGILATRCPTCGTFSLSWKGKVVAKVDLRAPTTQRSSLVGLAILPSLSTGTIALEVTSQGAPVPIEALVDNVS